MTASEFVCFNRFTQRSSHKKDGLFCWDMNIRTRTGTQNPTPKKLVVVDGLDNSPVMRVSDVDQNSICTCFWFDDTKNLHTSRFKRSDLIFLDLEDVQEKQAPDFDTTARMISKAGVGEEYLNAVRANRKIEAIKICRTVTGYGLKESKEWVEAHWDRCKT